MILAITTGMSECFHEQAVTSTLPKIDVIAVSPLYFSNLPMAPYVPYRTILKVHRSCHTKLARMASSTATAVART